MSLLSPTTIRRLSSLPKDQGVWEGDRRPLPALFKNHSDTDRSHGDVEWVLWVDDEKVIRAMDIVPESSGPEVLVRTLIKAIEYPQGPASPVCPRRVYVRDREDQFFLRGALQELDIEINYSAQLPLTNEIVQSMEIMSSAYGSALSPTFQNALDRMADRVWERTPWKELADHHIVELTLTPTDSSEASETYYLCCLGQMGLEFGLLLYRSLESLMEFRKNAIEQHDSNSEDLESIFLSQDCIFLNYELESPSLKSKKSSKFASVNMGTIHPLEGLRPFLEEEEAIMLMTGVEGFLRFHQRYKQRFDYEDFPNIKGNYSVRPVLSDPDYGTIKVGVKTLPDLSLELLELGAQLDDDALDPSQSINPEDLLELFTPQFTLDNELIPDQSLVSIGVMPWDLFAKMHHKAEELNINPVGDGLPIVMVQTSRPKAKKIQGQLEESGGLTSIGFLKGVDDGSEQGFDIGVLSTQDGVFHIFGEYEEDDPTHVLAREKWEHRIQETQGQCALVLTSGVTGVARGNPRPRDIMAILGAETLGEGILGLHPLQLRPYG